MMMRKQTRVGRWMAALSLAATAAAAPAAGQDWGSDDGVSQSIVSDSSVELLDPPSPAPSAGLTTVDGDGPALQSLPTGASAYDGEAVTVGSSSEGGWGVGELAGWTSDAWGYPRDQGPFDQPGLLQVLHDIKCATWTFRGDALILWRNAPRDIPIYSNTADTPNGLGATALSAGQMDSRAAAGPRLSVFRTDDCQNAWEFTWFKAANFRSQEATLPTLGGYGMTPPGIYGNNFGGLDTATSDLSASIWSFEVNRWVRWEPNIAFIHGFRMVGWGENLSLANHYDTTDTGFSQDVFRNNTTNDLYGYQIGTDIRLWDRGQGFRLDGILKGGAYYNNAVQNSSYLYQTGPDTSQFSNVRAAGGSAAFVGEVGMTGTLPITDNLALRVGYLGLWLQGLAQPTNQLRGQTITSGGQGTPVVGSLNTIGSTVVQGVSLGLEGRW